MAGRLQKQGLDFFPLDVHFFEDIKVRKIKKSFGAASTSILISILCSIYRDNGYYIGVDEELVFLIAETVGVSEGAVNEVLSKALQVGFFDERLYKMYKILTSTGIQKRYIKIVKDLGRAACGIEKRYNLSISREEIPINSEEMAISREEINLPPHPPLKTKLNKNKTNSAGACARTCESPPTMDEISEYCKEKGVAINPKDFFDYFEASDWFDSKGQKVKSWRGKLHTWNNLKSTVQKGNYTKCEDIPNVRTVATKSAAELQSEFNFVNGEDI